MSKWSATKAKRLLAALLRIGWRIKRETGSHRILARSGWPDVVFAFHDGEEIGPRMLTRIAKVTGLKFGDYGSYRSKCIFSSKTFRGKPIVQS